MKGIPALSLALILLAGCGGAPESMMITADTALISTSGGSGDARGKLIDKSLLEAAKLTQAHGYQFFTVLAADDAPRVARKFVPPAYVYQSGFADPRNRPSTIKSKDSPVNDITPVGANVTYMRPGLDITIRMYREGEIDPAMDGVWSSAKISRGRGAGPVSVACKHIAWMALAVVLAGCAGPQTSMMLTADTALISASGSSGDDRAKLINASLLEAARLASAHGFQYFTVVGVDDAPRTEHKLVAPAHVYHNGTNDVPYGNGNLPTLDSVYSSAAPVGDRVAYTRPGLDITIRMYHAGEVDPEQDGVWSSAKLLAGGTAAR